MDDGPIGWMMSCQSLELMLDKGSEQLTDGLIDQSIDRLMDERGGG